ncbi:hypothetical protein DXV76_17465 [Rhodobacteraceae bacterium CCMM004]|nr:hypothetical protein DXV76_17465 [Rhodobacteraceae bacterium CCMM004]
MSFVRPEAAAALRRWREAAAGAALAALGVWGMAGPGGLLFWIGGAAALAGLALVAVGVQRGRFRTGGEGPGVVRVVEGQLAYFGPLGGGIVAIADLTRVAAGAGLWHLSARDGTRLGIPMEAAGAEALFDVFARLPGLAPRDVLEAKTAPRTDGLRVLWQAEAPRLH